MMRTWGYEWLIRALETLVDINPYEVIQVLGASRRWPRTATSDTGVEVLTVWARTDAGRPLIVAVRRVGEWDWQMVGARELRVGELHEFEQSEAQQ